MKYLLFLFIIFVSYYSYAQGSKRIKISVKNDAYRFTKNGIERYPPCKIDDIDPTSVYVVVKKDYVTQGFTFSELADKSSLNEKGKRTYSIELEKIKPLPADYSSKVIEIYKVVDKTGRIIEFNFSDPFFTIELTSKLVAYGYKSVSNVELFDHKQKETQLKIAGEITQYSKNTIGPRFQISVIVNWTVYDVAEDKVVLQYSSAGFSDTESRFKSELGYALKDALTGLLSNTEFQKFARVEDIETLSSTNKCNRMVL